MSQALAVSSPSTAVLTADLRALLGDANVLTDPAELTFYSTDMFTRGTVAELVMRPASTEDLAKAVQLCAKADRSIIPRGGGFSYTSGYTPVVQGSVIVDLRRLNRVLEINAKDLYVAVECGCTWETLYEALRAKGLRTPVMGPASGYSSTVGGSLSQGGFFYGSTQYGVTGDMVLGLEVVLANGAVLCTGAADQDGALSPIRRNFGPDLTGLFLQDTGALGLKTKAVLKLIPMAEHQRFGSFVFDKRAQAIDCLSEIARQGLAAEAYVWDPVIAKGFAARNNLGDDFKYLSGVVKSGSSVLDGLKDAARMALAGKRIFDGASHMLHVCVEDISAAGADARIEAIRALASMRTGGEVEASAPRAARGTPFSNFAVKTAAAPANRNLPVHGLFPHSRAGAASAAIQGVLEAEKPLMEANGVTYGCIYFAVGPSTICIEPLLFWRDPQLGLHDRVNDVTDIATLNTLPHRSAGAQVVAELRQKIIEVCTSHGAVHFQIGKDYPYRELRQPAFVALLDAIKAIVDPDQRINPGSLGFDPTLSATAR